MSQNFEKLKSLLKELFQLDQPDLDFGLYRVMHAKSAEVSQFLDKDLLPQVQVAFGHYKTADKAEIEKELAKVIAGIEAAGMDPAQSPKVSELRTRLKNDAVDVSALESEVYDRLFNFFRRYYSEGDFLAKRVYKPGVYAIPYQGEEVTLHWANKDQYYIKTSEYLRDYAFRLRPDDDKKPMRGHFRLADAAEGEHGNVKAAEGKDRVFARPKAILGRLVQHCHPPSSVDVVDRILSDFRAGRQDVAEFWIDFKGRFAHIRYFALRDEKGAYLGTLEVTQDLTRERSLQGERRLLQYGS